jgi:hypothetical protein
MTFKPAIWRPIALGLSVLNLVAVGYAAGATEPLHAGVHAALALAFASWAQRMRQLPPVDDRDARLDELEGEVSGLRRELTETQERIDFTERLLVQEREARRVGPEQ